MKKIENKKQGRGRGEVRKKMEVSEETTNTSNLAEDRGGEGKNGHNGTDDDDAESTHTAARRQDDQQQQKEGITVQFFIHPLPLPSPDSSVRAASICPPLPRRFVQVQHILCCLLLLVGWGVVIDFSSTHFHILLGVSSSSRGGGVFFIHPSIHSFIHQQKWRATPPPPSMMRGDENGRQRR